MRPKTIAAIILIALGVVAFAYQGITYTTRDRVVDMGPLHISAEKTHNIPLSPIVGVVALVGGLALLLVQGKGVSAAV